MINTGIAGSLKAEINIGDLVISSDLVHHDMDAVSFGYPKDRFRRWMCSLLRRTRLADLAEKVVKRLIRKFRYFTEELSAAISSSQTKKPKNISTLSGYCTEMEGAAIAQTAHLNEVPFVVLRAISDKADDSASMDYPTFEKQESCSQRQTGFAA